MDPLGINELLQKSRVCLTAAWFQSRAQSSLRVFGQIDLVLSFFRVEQLMVRLQMLEPTFELSTAVYPVVRPSLHYINSLS